RVAVIVADKGEAVLVRLRVELLRGDLARLEALPAPIEPEIEVVVEGEPRRLAQRLGDRVEGLIAAGDPERGGAAPLDLERLVTDLDALLAAERGLDRAARRRRINRHVALRELLHDGAELGVLLGQPPDLRLLALGNQPAAWAHEEEAARAGGAGRRCSAMRAASARGSSGRRLLRPWIFRTTESTYSRSGWRIIGSIRSSNGISWCSSRVTASTSSRVTL